MIKVQPFGYPRVFGFGDGRHSRGRYPTEYYYSERMARRLTGIANAYDVVTLKSTSDIATLGSVRYFADVAGVLYAQDDAKNVLKEATPGGGNFAIDRTHADTAHGLLGDQKGRVLSFHGTALDMYNGSWNANWQTGLADYDHPADTYEDMVLFGNKTAVALLSGTDALNLTAFTLPSGMTIDALKAGPKGVLIGANLGYRGVLMLWNTQTDRSIAPWIWTKGKVQAIDRTESGWIVVTQKEILLTNGYTTRSLFPILDDPLAFNQYTVPASGLLYQNGKAFILNQNGGYGRFKPGIVIFDVGTQLQEFVPLPYSASASAIYAYKNVTQEIVLGYSDAFVSKKYISKLTVFGSQSGVYVSETLASSAEDKVAQAVILNLAPSTAISTLEQLTFTASVKLYNFKRPLWGFSLTNAVGTTTTICVDGSNGNLTKARVGDEVTILQGLNFGYVRHITAIANAGTNTETWTLDAALPNATEQFVNLNLQPYKLISRQTFTNLTELKELYFDARNDIRGKKFLVKVVFEGVTNAELELGSSHFVYDDLGYSS